VNPALFRSDGASVGSVVSFPPSYMFHHLPRVVGDERIVESGHTDHW